MCSYATLKKFLSQTVRFLVHLWMMNPEMDKLALVGMGFAFIQAHFKQHGDMKRYVEEDLFPKYLVAKCIQRPGQPTPPPPENAVPPANAGDNSDQSKSANPSDLAVSDTPTAPDNESQLEGTNPSDLGDLDPPTSPDNESQPLVTDKAESEESMAKDLGELAAPANESPQVDTSNEESKESEGTNPSDSAMAIPAASANESPPVATANEESKGSEGTNSANDSPQATTDNEESKESEGTNSSAVPDSFDTNNGTEDSAPLQQASQTSPPIESVVSPALSKVPMSPPEDSISPAASSPIASKKNEESSLATSNNGSTSLVAATKPASKKPASKKGRPLSSSIGSWLNPSGKLLKDDSYDLDEVSLDSELEQQVKDLMAAFDSSDIENEEENPLVAPTKDDNGNINPGNIQWRQNAIENYLEIKGFCDDMTSRSGLEPPSMGEQYDESAFKASMCAWRMHDEATMGATADDYKAGYKMWVSKCNQGDFPKYMASFYELMTMPTISCDRNILHLMEDWDTQQSSMDRKQVNAFIRKYIGSVVDDDSYELWVEVVEEVQGKEDNALTEKKKKGQLKRDENESDVESESNKKAKHA